MASHDPQQGDRPDLPSSQHQQMQGRTQARGQSDSEREYMPVEARTEEEKRRAAEVLHAGRDQPAGMGLGNAARDAAGSSADTGAAASAPASPTAERAGDARAGRGSAPKAASPAKK